MNHLPKAEQRNHILKILERLKYPSTTASLIADLEIFSFALNWRVYKTRKGIFLVGTEQTIIQAFEEYGDANFFMLQKVYG